MKPTATDTVTPFHWRRATAAASAPAASARARKPAAQRDRKKKLTVSQRIERILANRWGNPYCKPGPV